MTSREEIERLLQMTGRTLEGLPTEEEYLSADDCAERYRDIELAKRCGKFKCTVPFMIYQSDVIELLVGALRDALDKKPKWISIRERLPQDGQKVVMINEKFPSITLQGIYKADKTPDTIRVLGFGIGKVTHWIPQVEPPKEGE